MTNTTKTAKVLTRAIDEARAAEVALREQREEAERLLAQVRTARGSREVRGQARTAVAAVDLDRQLEVALRQAGPLSTAELAVKMGISVGKTSEAIGRARRRLARVGPSDQPAWIWRPGDEEPTPELMDLVRRMIERTPMTLAEIVDATGARRNRVSGAIAHLQYDEAIRKRIRNLGSPQVYRWWLEPARRGR